MAFCKNCLFSSYEQVLSVGSWHSTTRAVMNFSTSASKCKNTPHTVGVMSWVKSAYRRRYLERMMKEKPKSELQITKEEILKRQTPKIEFFTPSRTGEIRYMDAEARKNDLVVEPTTFLSDDKKTVICYHPPPKPYPISLTKRAVGQQLFAVKPEVLKTFKDSLSPEEVDEGKKLQDENPRLWNTTTLSLLFQCKPESVSFQIPLNKSQHERAKAEKEVYQEMSKIKRKQVRDLQFWERVTYMEKTRGKEFVTWYKTVSRAPVKKVYVPPKF